VAVGAATGTPAGTAAAEVPGQAAPKPATGAAPRGKGRTVAGAALFVLGFSFVFSTEGYAVGGIGELLRSHDAGLTQVFGGITVLLGLLFAGLFDRFTFAGRIFRPSARPQAGLAGAPLLGILFGFGWTPCIGPTLSAVLGMAGASGTAGRGAFLAFVYGLGLGIPFLIVAVAFQRVVNVLGFFRRNARLVSRLGGAFLVVVGLLELTGAWSSAVTWMHAHWFGSYTTPLLSPGSVPLALRRRDQRPYQPVVVALLRVPVHADREPAPGSLQGLHDVVTRCPAGERKAGPETTGGRGLMMGGGCRHLSSQQAAEGGFAAQLDIVRQAVSGRCPGRCWVSAPPAAAVMTCSPRPIASSGTSSSRADCIKVSSNRSRRRSAGSASSCGACPYSAASRSRPPVKTSPSTAPISELTECGGTGASTTGAPACSTALV
jgi:cytochrome c-type biogenesis protein